MAIRVLLVDDEPDMRMLVRLTLERTEDIDVVGEAASGTEGIEQAAVLTPDVILLDQMMPDLRGTDAAGRIFEAMGDGAPRIVLFTAWATPELRDVATSIGVRAFLSKDEFTAVADTIREVAGRA